MRKTLTTCLIALMCASGCVDNGDQPADGESEDTGDAQTSGPDESEDTANTEDSDGTETGGEHWCPACESPPTGEACPANAGVGEVAISLFDDGNYLLDETCVVATVTAEQLVLDCPTYDPEIGFYLNEEWTPNLAPGETVRFVADFNDNTENYGYNTSWRIEREDQSLALAATRVYYEVDSVGVGALSFVPVTGICAPTCDGEDVIEDVGLEFDFDGEKTTLFPGQHGTVAGYEYWINSARQRLCVMADEHSEHYYELFFSAL